MYLFPSWWLYNNDISGYDYSAQYDCVISDYWIRKNMKGSGHDLTSAKIEAFDEMDSVKSWKTSVRLANLWASIWTPTKWECHPLNGQIQEQGVNKRTDNKWILQKQGTGQVILYFLLLGLYCIVIFFFNQLLYDDSWIITMFWLISTHC